MLLFAAFRIDVLFFKTILHASDNVARVAHSAFIAAAAMPLIGAMQSFVRGMLTAHHLTIARFTAVVVAMVSLVVFLFLTVAFGAAGVVSASIALTGATLAELFVLANSFKRAKPRHAPL